MPSGTANSYADLQTALQAACTAAGYALNGNVLSKGTLFVEVAVQAYGLSVHAGTGQTAGALTGRSNYQLSYLGITIQTTSPTVSHPIVFPVSYDIYIGTAPDEVYLFINYEVNCYQYIGFGQSNMPGLGGTGNWYVGTACQNTTGSSWDFRTLGGGGANGSLFNCGMFDGLAGFGAANGGVHSFLEGPTQQWSPNYSFPDRWPVISNSPNAWNGESVLHPIQVYTSRTGGTCSVVAQLAHARWIMIDNLVDGQILTFGPDKWKVYPLWRRSARKVNMSPIPSDGGTGTLGHAIRYDGP
jgi:hypothetical protein